MDRNTTRYALWEKAQAKRRGDPHDLGGRDAARNVQPGIDERCRKFIEKGVLGAFAIGFRLKSAVRRAGYWLGEIHLRELRNTDPAMDALTRAFEHASSYLNNLDRSPVAATA